MAEYIVPVEDIGVDGAYFGYAELIRCRECKHALPQGKYGDWFICEMWDHQIHTSLNGYCYKAERKEEIRPYDPIWDMYLDEFEDAERKEE